MLSGRLKIQDLDYKVSEVDDSSDTKYYGFLETDGSWYIMREITSTGSYRYTRGAVSFPAAWTARASQVYNYYNVIF